VVCDNVAAAELRLTVWPRGAAIDTVGGFSAAPLGGSTPRRLFRLVTLAALVRALARRNHCAIPGSAGPCATDTLTDTVLGG
jgi:hypothetical protein